MLARAAAVAKVAPRRRLVVSVIVVALGAWSLGGGLREVRTAAATGITDPFTPEWPSIWWLGGGRPADLEALAIRVGSQTPPGSLVGVSAPASLGDQGDYLYYWFAFSLPTHHVRRIRELNLGEPADLWLRWDDSVPIAPEAQRRLRSLGPFGGAELLRLEPLTAKDRRELRRARQARRAAEDAAGSREPGS